MNALSEEKLQERQLIENPSAIVARAEKLLASRLWYELVAGLAITTGRRVTEIMKTARFFPSGLYTVIFEGQLKRRDIALAPYQIPTLAPAELVLSAWRRLRGLEDCTALDNDQVRAKYSKDANEAARRLFSDLIPCEGENLHTHTFRAVYCHIAVLWFCPLTVRDIFFVNAILGHSQVGADEKIARDFAATGHYYAYALSSESGQVDGRRGIRLDEPGMAVLDIFK